MNCFLPADLPLPTRILNISFFNLTKKRKVDIKCNSHYSIYFSCLLLVNERKKRIKLYHHNHDAIIDIKHLNVYVQYEYILIIMHVFFLVKSFFCFRYTEIGTASVRKQPSGLRNTHPSHVRFFSKSIVLFIESLIFDGFIRMS